jgi:hypothetical protein
MKSRPTARRRGPSDSARGRPLAGRRDAWQREAREVPMRIQPERTFEAIDGLHARTANPRHRAMLANYREHIAAELAGDVDRIMRTMSAEPVYHSYGPGLSGAGPRNQAETRAFYTAIFENGFNKLEKQIDRILVTDDAIVSEGWMLQIFPGRYLAAMGLPVDPDAYYLFRYRLIAVLPYEGQGTDVRMAGEDTYTAGAPTMDTITRLDPADVRGIVPEAA